MNLSSKQLACSFHRVPYILHVILPIQKPSSSHLFLPISSNSSVSLNRHVTSFYFISEEINKFSQLFAFLNKKIERAGVMFLNFS